MNFPFALGKQNLKIKSGLCPYPSMKQLLLVGQSTQDRAADKRLKNCTARGEGKGSLQVMESKEQGAKYLNMEDGHQKKKGRRKSSRIWTKGNRGSKETPRVPLEMGKNWEQAAGGPPVGHPSHSVGGNWHTAPGETRQEWEGRAWEGLERMWGNWQKSGGQLTRAVRLVFLMSLSLRASPRMIWGLASGTYTVVSFGITSFLWVSHHPPPIPIASS